MDQIRYTMDPEQAAKKLVEWAKGAQSDNTTVVVVRLRDSPVQELVEGAEGRESDEGATVVVDTLRDHPAQEITPVAPKKTLSDRLNALRHPSDLKGTAKQWSHDIREGLHDLKDKFAGHTRVTDSQEIRDPTTNHDHKGNVSGT